LADTQTREEAFLLWRPTGRESYSAALNKFLGISLWGAKASVSMPLLSVSAGCAQEISELYGTLTKAVRSFVECAAAYCSLNKGAESAFRSTRELNMHSKFFAIASAGLVMMVSTAGWAASSTVKKTPGHIMQTTPQARSTGPGASEYAPGHLKRKSGSESASQFTPSHRTTGMRTR
jgi:hypothetical protein